MAKKNKTRRKKKSSQNIEEGFGEFKNTEQFKSNFHEDRAVRPRKSSQQQQKCLEENDNSLQFEDAFEDEFEKEEIVEQEEMETDDESKMEETKLRPTVDGESSGDEENAATQVWRAGVDPIELGEELDFDPSAYIMYHSIRPEWPCLSFDILKDNLGDNRTRFPFTIFACCGTQADRAQENKITLMKMSDLHKTQIKEEEDEEEQSDDSETEDDPVLDYVHISHPSGSVNRIRSMPQQPAVVASWSDAGLVHLWDISAPFTMLQGSKPGPRSQRFDPITSFEGHPQEGWAMDWNPIQTGRLLTGDCSGHIHMWEMPTLGSWAVDQEPFVGHKGSVEDLQWSPSEQSVFVSCGVDRTVRVWDVRKKGGSMIAQDAHIADVNVVAWNRNVAYLLVSGSDDCSFKIWDLRQFGRSDPIAHFQFHQAPITSVQWHPTDESVVAVAGRDDQLTIWDLSVETDEAAGSSGPEDFPAQLLFIHQGQKEIKELRFHPQIPGVIMSTAFDGFNVFKPATNV